MSQQKRKSNNKNRKESRNARCSSSRRQSGAASSTKKSSSAAGKSRTASAASGEQGDQRREVLLILLAAVCVLLLLGNLDLAGRLGRNLREIQLGLFGILGYLFPFYLFWAGCFAYANGKEHPGNTVLKLITSVAALIAACGLAELLGGRGLVRRLTLAECYAYGADGLNGGWFGGLFYLRLYPVFGVLGTYVVLIVCLVIAVVITTGRSVVRPLQEHGGRMLEKSRMRSERRKEEAAIRREEEAVRREEEALARQEHYRQLELRRTELHAKSLSFGEETALMEGAADSAAPEKMPLSETKTEKEVPGRAVSGSTSSDEKMPIGEKISRLSRPERRKKHTGVTAEEISREDPESDDKNGFAPRRIHSTLSELDEMDERGSSGPVIHISGEEAGWSRPGLDDAGSGSAEWSSPVQFGQDADHLATSENSHSDDADADAERRSAEEAGAARSRLGSAGERANGERAQEDADDIPVVPADRAPEPLIFTGESRMRRLSEKPDQRQVTPDLLGGGGNLGPVIPEDSLAADAMPGGIAGDDGRQPDPSGPQSVPDESDVAEQTAEEDDGMSAYDEFDDVPESWELAMGRPEKGTGKEQRAASRHSDTGADIWRTGDAKDGNSGVTFGTAGSSRAQAGAQPADPGKSSLAKEMAGKAALSAAAAAGRSAAGKSAGAPEAVVPVSRNQALEKKQEHREYRLPPTALLNQSRPSSGVDAQQLRDTASKLQQTLDDFGVRVTVTEVSQGPSVTRYELHPDQGVKVSRIVALQDDIKLNLAVPDIRIEAPIPGKAAVGIEVPNKVSQTVAIADIIESHEFQKATSKITFGVGKGISGNVVVADLARMPHLLIAGATGSGKSVCINTIIMSILYKAKPDEVKLILIDPKMVELSVYNGIPHLMIPVVTDPKRASAALNWAVSEMTSRYQKFAEEQVRDIRGYNRKIENDPARQKMPQIVVIVDEMADLMMVAGSEVEDAICRLAQLARAAGIHLVLATQRPSVNVITGLIKANVQSRIAFAVSSGVDSRTILDMNGAEKLLGKGDMLFYPSNYPKPVRIQGAFVSDEEVEKVVDFWKEQADGDMTDAEVEQKIDASASESGSPGAADRDELFADAGRFIIEKDKASIGNLQRAFRIGFNRAARIMDQLADCGVVGPDEGTKAREILMDREQFEELLKKLG